jgi:FAD/FMN-containing dehydrogenase/Fe-S oxidoreductase
MMRIGDSALARRLERELEGEVLFDAFSRGRYSTDASIYQVEPIGVVVPRSDADIVCAVQIAAEEGIPVLPRGGGTSQCGQTVNEALVVDTSKYLNEVLAVDAVGWTARVQPGVVLDRLNKALKPHGLFFPIDPSTASRATIGGMAGNNTNGAHSIRYGNMVHNVRAIDAVNSAGEPWRFTEVPENLDGPNGNGSYHDLVGSIRGIAAREADEIEKRFPKLLRRVGGYNIDTVSPDGHNMARLLVGSEGTLAFFTALELDLQPIPPNKVLGVCHFPTFHGAMEATRHIVELGPAAVELVDRTMIDLAREIPAFRPTVEGFVVGQPEALLLVEFAGEDAAEQHRRLADLEELIATLGYPKAVVAITDTAFQGAVSEVRKAGLNIMMSMKGDGKPVSFIEDCAVPLEDLAEYTDRLTQVFHKHGTRGTWYAHASVGCLHVRPVLNMKDGEDVRKMRQIAEEAFAMVREYKGSHSGEHGDGIVRSEFHEAMFGARLVRAFEDVKDAFDPAGLFNPGRVVRPPRMDDRDLMRYKPGYAHHEMDTALDWSEWGGLGGAVEMCNNNGACRKSDPGVMCPSYRATSDEQHLTRGRANSLRLAISGQLGADALTSEAMNETMELCVSCKGCKRECPTGVDMARMKIEFLYQYRKRHGLGMKERLTAYLPRYAPWAKHLGFILNLRDRIPGLAALSRAAFGLSAGRTLPRWRPDVFRAPAVGGGDGPEVVLLADTFNTYFESENARAALAVLEAAGFRVHVPEPIDGGRPLCCGRTFLSVGLIDEARNEARRMIDTLRPYVEKSMPVIGLEPSCLLTLRDEYKAMLPGPDTDALAERAYLFEEFLVAASDNGRLSLPLKPSPWRRALIHGHCHQHAFAVMDSVVKALRLIPELEVETLEAGCCGMAGAFGYDAKHTDVSMKMAERTLLPAVRGTGEDTVVVADGTSCRHQIRDGGGREALHVARILQAALAP